MGRFQNESGIERWMKKDECSRKEFRRSPWESAVEPRQVGSQTICQFVDLSPGFIGNGNSFCSTLSVTTQFNFSGQKNFFDARLSPTVLD